MEFSKKIVRLSWGVNLVILLLIVILPMFQVPVDGLVSALPYTWGEVTVIQGFYLWKAKNENRHKYAMKYMDKLAVKFDPDVAIRIAEIVLKD
jgi:hypothetical protein